MRAAIAFVVLAACGASSGEVRTAREAKYDAQASVVFEAMRQAADEKYGIAAWDEGLGTLTTQPMWFTAEGAAAGRGTEDHPTQLKDDMVHLTFDLAIVGSEPPFQVQIKPVALRLVSFSSNMQPLNENDMPYWVQDKVDGLYLAIHGKLEGSVVTPEAAPAR